MHFLDFKLCYLRREPEREGGGGLHLELNHWGSRPRETSKVALHVSLKISMRIHCLDQLIAVVETMGGVS